MSPHKRTLPQELLATTAESRFMQIADAYFYRHQFWKRA